MARRTKEGKNPPAIPTVSCSVRVEVRFAAPTILLWQWTAAMASDPSHASELRIIVEAGDSDGESGTGAKRKRRPAPCDNCR